MPARITVEELTARQLTARPPTATIAVLPDLHRGKAGVIDGTSQPQPTIDYDDAVAEGKRIVDRMDGDWMRLAELADQVGTTYGEQTLDKFAEEIGAVACTLKRRLSTFRA